MIYLYIKQHRVTGLKYFGATKRNPYSYNGSGIRWLNHCRKHGFDIQTVDVTGFDDMDLCKRYALKFSRENDIVASKDWANLIEEDGINGGANGYIRTPEIRLKISEAKRGKNIGSDNHFFGKHHSDQTKQKISNAKKGKSVGRDNPFFGRTHTDETRIKISQAQTGHIKSSETRMKSSVALLGKPKSEGFRESIKDYSSKRKWIVNQEGKIGHCIDNNDPRLLSGHWVFGKKWKG